MEPQVDLPAFVRERRVLGGPCIKVNSISKMIDRGACRNTLSLQRNNADCGTSNTNAVGKMGQDRPLETVGENKGGYLESGDKRMFGNVVS